MAEWAVVVWDQPWVPISEVWTQSYGQEEASEGLSVRAPWEKSGTCRGIACMCYGGFFHRMLPGGMTPSKSASNSCQFCMEKNGVRCFQSLFFFFSM